MGCCKQRYYFFHDAPPLCAPDVATLCGKLLCAPVVVGKRFSSVGRHWCALRKARRAPLHPIGEYALLSPRLRRQIAASEKRPRGGSEKWGAFCTNRPCFCSSFPCFSPLPLARAHQEVFVFCLHRFTHPLQRHDCQHVWCEGFLFFPFTLCITPPSLLPFAQKVCFSAGLFSKTRKYRTETADGEGEYQKPSPRTNSRSTDCTHQVKR